jgi:soluble lytic murein transglycosylase
MMNRILSSAIGAVLSWSLIGAPALAADADEALRAQFTVALEQAQRGMPTATPDSTALRSYVLYPYLQAERLKAQLKPLVDGVDARIAAFIASNTVPPATRELRRRWLNSLAERGLWSDYLLHHVADAQDPGLQCHRFQARIVTGDLAGLQDELAAFWADAPQMPGACVAPFRWLQEQGGQTAELTERRARKALDSGNVALAEMLLRQLPEANATRLQQWLRLLKDPAKELRVIAAEPATSFEWQALLAGFSRLARRDSPAAAEVLRSFDRKRFTAAQYQELASWVGLGMSWDRRPEALYWFRMLPASVPDERVHEWRVRSALWNGETALASEWLQQQPATLAADPRWTYWRARSLEKLGQRHQSQALYRTLAQDNGYYSVLSAWRLGEKYQPKAEPLPASPAVQAQLLSRPETIRARELHLVGQPVWANAEWAAVTRDLDDAAKQQAARLAAQWGWHVQAVATLGQTSARNVLEVLYPDPYAPEIRRGAEQVQLPPAWIYGVMRQESLFQPQAQSSANAYGLLQLLLPTAQGVARRWSLPRPTREELFKPDVNIPLGAAYLREMTDRFGGQFLLTLAAYNAGPNAVPRWLPSAPMDADVWVENVPYNETRGYLQRIVWHIAARGWMSSGKPQDLSGLLQPVHRPAAP